VKIPETKAVSDKLTDSEITNEIPKEFAQILTIVEDLQKAQAKKKKGIICADFNVY
jgi:hypothetical protein